MHSLDQAGLERQERARLEAILELDPELAAELELIVDLLDPDARARFWRAFAEGSRGRERPAGEVLAALERAALERH